MIKINVRGKTARQIRIEFGLNRTAAYRAKKRGYCCPTYLKKEINISQVNLKKINFKEIEVMARSVYFRTFGREKSYLLNHLDDILQESCLRVIELSGKQEMLDKSFVFQVIRNAQRDYVNRIKKGWGIKLRG